MTGVRGRAAAAGFGVVLDRLLGEPPMRPHPVAAFGWLMERLEEPIYLDDRPQGLAYLGAGAGLALAAGGVVRYTTAGTYLAVAGRSLADEALSIRALLEDGDLDGARAALPALVGRDPSGLDQAEVARAVVESVAENTVDAVVAPVVWAASAGAAGALGYRAVNTLDAMVGHRSPRYDRFGWASARFDDLAGWVPARITAALVVAVRPRSAGAVWRAVRHDAPRHPSPNSGVAEAAFAAALGLRLGGSSSYDGREELRPSLGEGRPPEPADIARAVHLSTDVSLALAATLAAVALASRSARAARLARHRRTR